VTMEDQELSAIKGVERAHGVALRVASDCRLA
jgi:hypothetical protein